MRPLLPLLFCLWLPTTLQAKPQETASSSAATGPRLQRIRTALAIARPYFPTTDFSEWEKGNADPDNVNAMMRQFAAHAQTYPQVAKDLQAVECNNQRFVGSQIGVTWDNGHRGLIRVAFKEQWLRSDRAVAARKVSHEFGHVLHHWLWYVKPDETRTFFRDVLKANRQEDGQERFAESFEELIWVKDPKKRRSGAAKVEQFLKETMPAP